MTKEELLKRQSELDQEFKQLSDKRKELQNAISIVEAEMNQKTGAYNELQRQIELLDTPKQNEN